MKVGVEDASGGPGDGESMAGYGERSGAPSLVAEYPAREADTQRPSGGLAPRTKALFLIAAGIAAWAVVFLAWQILT